MKYIRTENGIEKLDADREHLAEYMNGKQADTIEELCDEYVVNCSKDYEYPEYYPKVCEDWLLDDYSQADGFTIYGAILRCKHGTRKD